MKDEEPRSGGVVTLEGDPADESSVTDEPDRVGAEPIVDGPVEPDTAVAVDTAEPEAGPAVTDAPVVAPRRTSRRTHVRRGLVATGAALAVALSVSAFSMVGPTIANADQSFVDTARSQGHAVASGDQETLVVSAAHKICERRDSHSTVAERKATALSPAELGAVQQTFTTDVRGFTTLALDTYCPN